MNALLPINRRLAVRKNINENVSIEYEIVTCLSEKALKVAVLNSIYNEW